MKTKEQELILLGLQEINESEKNEVTGGIVGDFKPAIIYCCVNIPPMVIDDIFQPKIPVEW